MKRLILTGCDSNLERSGLADIVISFHFRFHWGLLPSPEMLSAYFAAYTTDLGPGDHWSDWVRWPKGATAGKRLSLADFCERFDVVELWFEKTARDQLQLVWLLDHLATCPALAEKLALRLLAGELMLNPAEDVAECEPDIPLTPVAPKELETARLAWQAYRAPTPEACTDLVHRDLGALLMLRPALQDLLAELPSPSTGLGATEMRFLEMLAFGYANTNALFHLSFYRRTDVYGEVELGWLLQPLALGPRPVIAGLDEDLRTIDRNNQGARHRAFLRSRLSLTEFGEAVLAHQEDFSHHNPIDRWWGGTHLTNDQLWRYGSVLTKP